VLNLCLTVKIFLKAEHADAFAKLKPHTGGTPQVAQRFFRQVLTFIISCIAFFV
jgi:hypothetical protein